MAGTDAGGDVAGDVSGGADGGKDAGGGGSAPAGGTLRLSTADGGTVVADLVVPARAWAGAVVCHPHPAYGGDRHNLVVDRIFRTVAGAGIATARFDFRPGAAREADTGTGVDPAQPDGGAGRLTPAQADVVAAIDAVAGRLAPGRPLWLVGYSFGADVALSVDDPRVAGWAAVAPPLHFGPPPRPADGDPRPVLVLAAEHDQFSPPDRLRQAVASWADASVVVISMADHFLAGATGPVADAVADWIRIRSPGAGPA